LKNSAQFILRGLGRPNLMPGDAVIDDVRQWVMVYCIEPLPTLVCLYV